MSDRWHLGFLDSLRGIAIIGVIMVHAWYWEGHAVTLPRALGAICGTGQRGVQLFFIVSAFTLYLSHDNRRFEHRPTQNFFIRRMFRITPMFYVAALVSYTFLREWFGTWRDAWPSLLLLHGLSPNSIMHGPAGGWSVADEAIFYLSLPLLFHWVRDLRAALIAFCISAPTLRVASYFLAARFPQQSEFIHFLSFPIQIPVFLMGIAGYFLWRDYLSSSSMRKNAFFALITCAALLYFSFLPFDSRTLYDTSLAFLMLTLALAAHPWQVLVNRTTRFLGKISYSIYLLHFVVMHNLQHWVDTHKADWPPILKVSFCFLACLVATIPIAYVSWRWVEIPGIRAGRRIIALRENKIPNELTRIRPWAKSSPACE